MRPQVGETVVITEIMNGNAAVNLAVGETLVVGEVDMKFIPEHINGFVWLSDNPTTKCGWVKWTYPQEQPAAVVGLPEIGQRIEIIESQNQSRLLKPGDVIKVGCTYPGVGCDGFVWVTTGSMPEGQHGEHFGWVKWKPVTEQLPETPAPSVLRARVGRQRRELRRLNQQNRQLRLERDYALMATEDLMQAYVVQSKARRAAEMMLQ